MIPTSQAQFDAFRAGALPRSAEIAPGIFQVPIPFEPRGVLFNFCYLIEDDGSGVHLIDPGWDSPDGWRALESALTRFGRSLDDLSQIILTHRHVDHLQMAPRLARASGARLTMHEREMKEVVDGLSPVMDAPPLAAWGVPTEHHGSLLQSTMARRARQLRIPSDLELKTLEDGECIDISGRRLRTLHTPGHTNGHICIADEDNGLLFTGDHILPVTRPGIGLGGESRDNPVTSYLRSLRRLEVFGDSTVHPGHEFSFRDLLSRIRSLVSHQLRRSNEVSGALDEHPSASIWDVASRLSWSTGWPNLKGIQLVLALTQTAAHVDRLRNPVNGGGEVRTR